jgi:23S rRNA (guanosine2251-2'-O)-methyltransferase
MNENIIIGRQPVLEALKTRQSIAAIFLQHGSAGEYFQTIQKLARAQGIQVKEAGKERFRELAGDALTQGIIAVTGEYEYVEVDDILNHAKSLQQPPFVLVLDEIEDPHNLGALIRTAECAGLHGVIIPRHHAAGVNSTVMKTSAGAASHIRIARVTNIAQTLVELKENGLWIIGTDMHGEKTYFAQDYRGAIAIVIGNEGHGMRRLVKERCDFLVTIPMRGQIESLNASVAGALVMFEAVKTR